MDFSNFSQIWRLTMKHRDFDAEMHSWEEYNTYLKKCITHTLSKEYLSTNIHRYNKIVIQASVFLPTWEDEFYMAQKHRPGAWMFVLDANTLVLGNYHIEFQYDLFKPSVGVEKHRISIDYQSIHSVHEHHKFLETVVFFRGYRYAEKRHFFE